MLRQAIRDFPGVPQLIKLNTDFEDWWFDFRHGTNTRADRADQMQKGWETDPVNHTYVATRPKCAQRVFANLPVKDVHEYTFVDFGCGKGRLLLLAEALPFQRLVGIELRKEVYDLAIQNFQRTRGPGSRNIECLNIDATQFEFPNEKMVVFMFNPFGEKVLRSVLENLGRSLASSFRDVIVVFAMTIPEFMLMADSMPFLSLVTAGYGFRIYRSQIPEVAVSKSA